MKILFLAANPQGTERLKLDEEAKAIETRLKSSKLRDQFQLITKWAVGPDELRSALLEHHDVSGEEAKRPPIIVHFSGHGEGQEGLVLVEDGRPKPATAEALSGLFKFFPSVKCVLLNACYAEVQARALVKHIDYVIGMKQVVQDTAAIKFAAAFYEVLGYGRSIEDAFGLGCNAIQLNAGNFTGANRKLIPIGFEGFEENANKLESHQIPVLLKKNFGLVDLNSVQSGITERVKAKDISKEEALEQFRVEVQTILKTGAITNTKWIQLGTSATVLGITEEEANRILEEEQSRQGKFGTQISLNSFEFQFPNLDIIERQVEKQVKKRRFICKRIENIIITEQFCHITYQRRQTDYFAEDLGNDVTLEMVAIAGGTFVMGQTEEEKQQLIWQVGAENYQKRFASELPQHRVTVQPCFMGRFAVTQAQWQAVAGLPKVNRDLDPDPSHFKGDRRPVENVIWYDAVEFCDRLSRKTGRPYRLPSEAEWEYACRAGTTTPFYCGETITTNLANYDGNSTYGSGPQGIHQEETTNVGSFPPNAFGLYDMHGNVWEWCADHWHENYQGAPNDGSAWITGGNSNKRLVRGGSWYRNPWDCRAACRSSCNLDYQNSVLGFRVVCVLA